MGFFANKRNRAVLGCFAVLAVSFALPPADASAKQNSQSTCKVVVLGFVGGLDAPGNPFSGIVQIRNRLRKLNEEGLCAKTFSAYTWLDGYHWLVKKLAETGPSASPTASPGAKVIIYGHSLGGWATVAVSRRLAALNIPVELTVQIDSVGLTDETIPSNVKQAANFYRWAILPPYSRHKIHAQDPDATQILGNFERKGANHVGIALAPAISDLIVAKAQELYAAPE